MFMWIINYICVCVTLLFYTSLSSFSTQILQHFPIALLQFKKGFFSELMLFFGIYYYTARQIER